MELFSTENQWTLPTLHPQLMWYEEIKSRHKPQKQNHSLSINFLIPYDLSLLQKDISTHF